MKNPEFLKRYNLHNDPEVEKAAKRTEARTNESVSGDAESRIQNYLDRFKEITNREDESKKERGLEALKQILHKEYIIDSDTASEQYIKIQKKIARAQGHGDLEIPPHLEAEIKQAAKDLIKGDSSEQVLNSFPNEEKQLIEEIVALVEGQEQSLDNWIDYLSSDDAIYPDWLKYWAIRSITGLSEYDKDKKKFPKRGKTTINAFPDLNREALAYVLDSVQKKYENKNIDKLENLEPEEQEEFNNLLNTENFAKLYAWAVEKLQPVNQELLTNTDGQWIKYDQASNHLPLVKSIQGHGTGWCTAGETTAESQLSRGDFYIYYSKDEKGENTIPRAAIRMEGDEIAEVRGIDYEQNLDPYIAPVVSEKMSEFPDGEAYQKKAEDMKRLTTIEAKTKKGEELLKENLTFLYEIDHTIQGFGYQRDPRIKEIRETRNLVEDMPIVFECEPSQIAKTSEEIDENTKAYVGELKPGIFNILEQYNIEHIYTKFPENRIRREQLEIGNKLKEELIKELEEKGINISQFARDMLESPDFYVSKTLEELNLIRLKVSDLGFPSGATTTEIYEKVDNLGLELCPPETGPQLRLKYQDQPLNEWLRIGMKQISVRHGYPLVFYLGSRASGLWLSHNWVHPDYKWYSDREFVFRSRKLDS